jgi:hypothetical protein
MLDAATGLSGARTVMVVATDDDDPQAAAYDAALKPLLDSGEVHHLHGPRRGLAAWTNAIARLYAPELRALASFGDDHVPRTQGWDRLLLEALDGLGCPGIVYPDDRRRADIPEAPVISSEIVLALGWMCEPSLRHFYVDNVWADIGRAAGCLAYVPGVIVEHLHYQARPDVAVRDATYAEAEARGGEDQTAYLAWRQNRFAEDAAVIRGLAQH